MRCLLLGSMRGFLVTEYPPWRGVQVKHQREDRLTGYILKLKLSSTQVLTGSEWIDLEPDVSPRPLWFQRNFVILETDWVYLLQVLDLVSFNKEINVQFRIEHFLNLDWTLIITKVKEIKTSKTVTIYVCVFVLVCLPVVRFSGVTPPLFTHSYGTCTETTFLKMLNDFRWNLYLKNYCIKLCLIWHSRPGVRNLFNGESQKSHIF